MVRHWKISLVAMMLICSILMTSCSKAQNYQQTELNTDGPALTEQQNACSDTVPLQTNVEETAIMPEFPEEVLLCSAEAKLVYDGEMSVKDAAASGDPYEPLTISYRLVQGPGSLWLSESQDMHDAVLFTLEQDEESLSIDNLKTGTTYFYRVQAEGEDYSGSFRTAYSNRYVTMPDAVNTRDIGGYKTLDGCIVKQGLLIRGSELDGLVETDFFLRTEALQGTMDTFSFVYDLDLREPQIYVGEYWSRLGEAVGHRFYDAPVYGQVFQKYYIQRLRQVFVDLADPDKYPIYLHCTYGADRTGIVVFLLQGLLKVSEEDMVREYQLTEFSSPGFSEKNRIEVVINGLAPYPGETLHEKIEYFLTWEIGVKQSAIASIRNIFLEQAAGDSEAK